MVRSVIRSTDLLSPFILFLTILTQVAQCRTKLAVRPNSARAVLFYSQHPNGEMDEFSRHGACPILRGEKWAGTYKPQFLCRKIPGVTTNMLLTDSLQPTCGSGTLFGPVLTATRKIRSTKKRSNTLKVAQVSSRFTPRSRIVVTCVSLIMPSCILRISSGRNWGRTIRQWQRQLTKPMNGMCA